MNAREENNSVEAVAAAVGITRENAEELGLYALKVILEMDPVKYAAREAKIRNYAETAPERPCFAALKAVGKKAEAYVLKILDFLRDNTLRQFTNVDHVDCYGNLYETKVSNDCLYANHMVDDDFRKQWINVKLMDGTNPGCERIGSFLRGMRSQMNLFGIIVVNEYIYKTPRERRLGKSNETHAYIFRVKRLLRRIVRLLKAGDTTKCVRQGEEMVRLHISVLESVGIPLEKWTRRQAKNYAREHNHGEIRARGV